jgi:hypothetical protein
MTRTLTALVAGATMTLAAVATPTPAEARHFGWRGPAILGGIAAAAFIGGALARPYHGGYYGGYGYPAYAYYPAPVYYSYYVPAYAPAYYYAPRPVHYGCVRWRHGYRVRVC